MKLFDLHCDTLTVCEQSNESLLSNSCHLDLKRGLSHYRSWAQVMAIYVPDNMPKDRTWEYTSRVLDFLDKQAFSCEILSVIKTPKELCCALSEDSVSCAVLPAIENGAAIGEDLSRLSLLSRRGIVYLTITWNGSNVWGHGCMSDKTNGLTLFGKKGVEELFRVGILPDVSHLNEAGFWDVAEIANNRPFLASHSVSKAICNHPRNLTDDQFATIRDSKGVVGLNLCQSQLGEQTFECLERHLDHFLSLGGEDTVALGMDLDGTDLPDQWNGIAVGAALYAHLSARSYPKALLDKIFFKNSQAFLMKTLTSKEECIRIGT